MKERREKGQEGTEKRWYIARKKGELSGHSAHSRACLQFQAAIRFPILSHKGDSNAAGPFFTSLAFTESALHFILDESMPCLGLGNAFAAQVTYNSPPCDFNVLMSLFLPYCMPLCSSMPKHASRDVPALFGTGLLRWSLRPEESRSLLNPVTFLLDLPAPALGAVAECCKI
jgi:hypothetical protein